MSKQTATQNANGHNRSVFVILLAGILCAGIASLFYEVLWVRQLGLSLGSTAVANSIMLSAFLGGLAIGSAIMGRRADHLKHPARVLCIIEIAAGIVGVLSIPALGAAGHAYVFLANAWGAVGTWGMILRAVFSLIVMLIPAILFGLTFPLTTAIGGKLVAGQTAAGLVSAISSFGSAAGALICGLWLEPALGISASAAVGAGFNLLSAVFALLIAFLIGRMIFVEH